MTVIKFPKKGGKKNESNEDNNEVSLESLTEFLEENGIEFTSYPHPSEMTDEQIRESSGIIKKNALAWRSKNLDKI